MFLNRKKMNHLVLLSSIILLGIASTRCSYVTPESENPVPGLENPSTKGVVKDGVLSIRKSFLGVEIDQKRNKWKYTDKTWLCGWAPVRQSGKLKNWGALTGAPYNSRHCNMQFRISDDGKLLEAVEVNVDKPENKDWQPLMVIPIIQHYFYERQVDSRGRELNKYAKVSDRKNWQLQPIMDLDLSRIVITNKEKQSLQLFGAYSLFNGTWMNDVHDIELTTHKDKNFFGFTANQMSTVFGSAVSHEIRFNFLEFEGTPGFEVTPYDPNTVAKRMNILHILGTREDGINEKNYAAHWDFRQPIDLCLTGFPEGSRYRKIGVEVIEEVNNTLRRIKALKSNQKGFVVKKENFKYDFDLRCPNIHWVADPELSFRAPLGIGLVNTNIRTGQIMWGTAIVWGGLIDYLVNRDAESPVDSMIRNTHEVVSQIPHVKDAPYFTDINEELSNKGVSWAQPITKFPELHDVDLMKDLLAEALSEYAKEGIDTTGAASDAAKMMQMHKIARTFGLEEQIETATKDFRNPEYALFLESKGLDVESNVTKLVNQKTVEIVESALSGLKDSIANNMDEDLLPNYLDLEKGGDTFTEEEYKEKLRRKSGLGVSAHYSDLEKEKKAAIANSDNPEVLRKNLINDYKSFLGHDADWDNTVEQHYNQWLEETADLGIPEREEAAISVIKNVMLHEFGHVLGMGHQFKGNILPERGTIPEALYQTMKEEVAEGHFYTSIMDYQSGQTEVAIKPEDVTLRTQDEFVLQYLYNRKVPTFTPGEESFTMVPLAVDGSIEQEVYYKGQPRQVRYMPQCSDVEAWLATDPYCRRWDRGHDAPSIVTENYNSFKDSFIKRTNSFSQATGGSAYYKSWRLWSDTYTLMNYNRTFYDKMRFDMLDDINRPTYNDVFKKFVEDRDVLIEFSDACVDPLIASERYQENFAKLVLQPTAGKSGRIKENERRSAEANYDNLNGDLLRKYRTAMNEFDGRSFSELNAEQVDELETNLFDMGVAFTELHKLCRANKLALNQTKTLLSLPGYDKTEYDFEGSIVPTGLRAANATAKYDKLFGRFIKLGMLPLKLAALSVLTAPSSTMRYGYWRIGKPQYSGSKGNYSFYSFYPEEYTDIVRESVDNNMSFGGKDLGDATTLSLANLYLSYFLRRDLMSTRDNLRRKFDDIFLSDVQGQTRFRVNLSPVLFEAVIDDKISDSTIFGFTPKIFSRAKDGLITLPEAYVLPHGNTVVSGTDGQIILPITNLRFISEKMAYVWAIEVTYAPTRDGDPLQGFSVKSVMGRLTGNQVENCMGNQNGLRTFFVKSNRLTGEDGENPADKFEGFRTSSNIAVSGPTQKDFNLSVIEQFDKYNSLIGPKKPDQIECSESRNGLGLISATALSLNGWILPQVFQYLE